MSKENKNDVTILVCCHKDDYHYESPGFLPIQVGKEIAKTDLKIQGDNTGDNISDKNPNYCELTAHYWLWKNGPKTKYVGLNHYRRYFDFNLKLPFGSPYKVTTVNDIEANPPTLPNLDKIFEKYDIVLAKRTIYPFSLGLDYCRCHIVEDLNILKEVVNDLYPEYNASFDRVMRKSHRLSHYNMNVVRRRLFDQYSEWLFNILFEVEKRVKISPYPAQARIFGYMSERLLNVYVHHHHLKVKYVPVVMVDDSGHQSMTRNFIRGMRDSLTGFILTKFNNVY